MVRKNRSQLRNTQVLLSDSLLAEQIGEALRLELEPIGNIPPAEAEQQYYAMLDDTAMAA